MARAREISLSVLFEKRADGRYHASSSDLPGFRMAGTDWASLQADLEPAIRDLLWRNSSILTHSIKWVPSLSTVTQRVVTEGSTAASIVITPLKYADYPLWRFKLLNFVRQQGANILEWLGRFLQKRIRR
jgi:hypothetical protein